jgi:hypothetical protein
MVCIFVYWLPASLARKIPKVVGYEGPLLRLALAHHAQWDRSLSVTLNTEHRSPGRAFRDHPTRPPTELQVRPLATQPRDSVELITLVGGV